MVYFFSISHLALEDFREVLSALRRSHCPGVGTAAAWYVERGGPWRVRFIYGAHYTVDLSAVSNPALQASLQLTPTAGGTLGLLSVHRSGGRDACVSWTITRATRPSSRHHSGLAASRAGGLADEDSGITTCLDT